MQADTITVRLEVKDSQTRGVLEEIMNSAGGFVLQAPEDRGNCDLLILETGDDSKKDFERIHQLQSDGIVSHVFLTSKDSDPDKLIRAMRAGVKEFMGDRPHPGKDRTSGYFGFAGHNDPVAFRHIAIKPL